MTFWSFMKLIKMTSIKNSENILQYFNILLINIIMQNINKIKIKIYFYDKPYIIYTHSPQQYTIEFICSIAFGSKSRQIKFPTSKSWQIKIPKQLKYRQIKIPGFWCRDFDYRDFECNPYIHIKRRYTPKKILWPGNTK